MCDIIVLMEFVAKLKEKDFNCKALRPTIYCKAFEDNVGAIKLAKLPKMRPRAKHLNIKYHHFRSHVTAEKATVEHNSTEEQQANLLKKPLAPELFVKLRKKITGW